MEKIWRDLFPIKNVETLFSYRKKLERFYSDGFGKKIRIDFSLERFFQYKKSFEDIFCIKNGDFFLWYRKDFGDIFLYRNKKWRHFFVKK